MSIIGGDYEQLTILKSSVDRTAEVAVEGTAAVGSLDWREAGQEVVAVLDCLFQAGF